MEKCREVSLDKILLSSCFLGNKVRYDGKDNLLTESVIQRWQRQQRLVVICPELAGGLATPRAPAEIQHKKDMGIQVITDTGEDVTTAFERGANEALRLCQLHGVRYALLKESSPSCGSTMIYDGSFSNKKIPGQGLTTQLLKAHDIKVYSETNMQELFADMAVIDAKL